MTASIEIDRRQLGAASDAFERLSKVVSDLQPTNDAIGAYIVASTQRRFERQAGPDGTAWKPSQRAIAQSGQTLRDTGRLFKSIAHRATSDLVEVGSNLIYAGVHQFGATIHAKKGPNLKFKIGDHWISKPSVTIGARPYLGINAEDVREIGAIVFGDLEAAREGKPA